MAEVYRVLCSNFRSTRALITRASPSQISRYTTYPLQGGADVLPLVSVPLVHCKVGPIHYRGPLLDGKHATCILRGGADISSSEYTTYPLRGGADIFTSQPHGKIKHVWSTFT